MKIGSFAGHFGVSRDTVRYYCKLGLLIPDDSGAQMDFKEREMRDMEQIMRLRSWNFSMNEIRKYMDIRRVSTMVEPETIQDILTMLEEKRNHLAEEAKNLTDICSDIDRQIGQILNRDEKPRAHTGVPLSALSLLVCPECGEPLELENAALSRKYIYRGRLCCRCGYHAEIEDGIVRTENVYAGGHDSPDLRRGLYRDVSDDFVGYMQRCTNYALKTLQKMDLHHKVILESHINGYFFLYNHLRSLSGDCTYIIVDKYPEMLKMYKRNIEHLGMEMNILYIADASMNWPLRHHAADVLISFMADNEHSLYFDMPYIRDIKRYLSPSAPVIGAALGYHYGAKSLKELKKKYPEGSNTAFIYEAFPMMYEAEGYQMERRVVGSMRKTAAQYAFSCHVDGEELLMSHFAASPKME